MPEGDTLFRATYTLRLALKGSAGYAGFTGPTFWLNRNARHVAIILNNHVHLTRDGLSRFPVHRRVARWLLSASLENRWDATHRRVIIDRHEHFFVSAPAFCRCRCQPRSVLH